MAVQTTSNLTNSITNVYKGKYLQGAKKIRLYDQFATPYTELGADGKTMDELMRATNIYVPFISDMTPGSSAISQTADVTPQTLTDATAYITSTSRGEALQWSQQLTIQAYTDYTAAAYEKVGANAMETIEQLAIDAALAGSWVERAAARASLDAGTPSHRASDSLFRKYYATMLSMKVPGFITADGQANTWIAIMHPYVWGDICESGNYEAIGIYQDRGIHLNFEAGQIGSFRVVSHAYAKVFGGAGADNGTSVAGTLASANSPLDLTLTTSSDHSANIAYGLLWTVGTEETANTFYPTNERVKVLSASTVTLTVNGEGENGGMRFAHAASTAVRNADSAYTICFAGPQSLVKLYDPGVGEYGQFVEPHVTGNLNQFTTAGWKFYGGYGRVRENSLLRYECSTSYEA